MRTHATKCWTNTEVDDYGGHHKKRVNPRNLTRLDQILSTITSITYLTSCSYKQFLYITQPLTTYETGGGGGSKAVDVPGDSYTQRALRQRRFMADRPGSTSFHISVRKSRTIHRIESHRRRGRKNDGQLPVRVGYEDLVLLASSRRVPNIPTVVDGCESSVSHDFR